jgi:uncharacterized protein
MKLLLLGATGRIGKLVLSYALEDEKIKSVKVLARNPLRMTIKEHSKLTIYQGDLFSSNDLVFMFKDVDIVICSVGPNNLEEPRGFYEKACGHIVDAIGESHTSAQVILLCGLGILPADSAHVKPEDLAVYETDNGGGVPGWLIPICKDMHAGVKKLMGQRRTKWTIVCPPHIPHGFARWVPFYGMTGLLKKTQRYKVKVNENLYSTFSPFHCISAEDVADFLLKCGGLAEYENKRVAIGY